MTGPESECQDRIFTGEVILMNRSDLKLVDGMVVVKRKYGKFTRPIIKLTK